MLDLINLMIKVQEFLFIQGGNMMKVDLISKKPSPSKIKEVKGSMVIFSQMKKGKATGELVAVNAETVQLKITEQAYDFINADEASQEETKKEIIAKITGVKVPENSSTASPETTTPEAEKPAS